MPAGMHHNHRFTVCDYPLVYFHIFAYIIRNKCYTETIMTLPVNIKHPNCFQANRNIFEKATFFVKKSSSDDFMQSEQTIMI